jgi:hypothetical protein
MAILELQERGAIQMLYNKWWKNTGTCNHDEKKQVGGAFLLLSKIKVYWTQSLRVIFHINILEE